ncbi:MAG TPA: alpha/beta hydrolase fold domain-containing protein, partial [Ilumatobacteraceae bacterium]
MGLSAHAAELLARLNDGLPPVETLPPVDARQRMVDKRLRAAPAEQVAVGAVEHVLVPTRSHEARVRLYHPAGNEPAPVVVFFHGGGWVLCDLDSHDAICRRLCAGAGCVVASVEYRLAPEDPFPAAVHDAIDVTTWIAAHSEVVGGRAGALAVAGDSAGGNLAAVVTQLARARGGPAIAFQALV